MNAKELRELIDYLVDKDIAEFELERGDVKVRMKRGVMVSATPFTMAVPAASPVVAHPPAAAHAAAPPQAASAPPVPTPAEPEEGLHLVKSPIVGTFYESSSPGAPPFVKVGDSVKEGQPLCIVEAMKLMNEIEADVSGEIVKILVSNAQPVEYGQPLFAIRTR